jgi:hypothetical protein
MNAIRLLNTTMPFSRGLKKEILYVCLSGGFALFVFYVLHPFGSRLQNSSLIAYSLVSIVLACIYLVATHQMFRLFWSDKRWTVGLEITHSLLFLVFIATGIMVYGYVGNITPLNLENLIRYLFYTILLGTIPVTIRAVLVLNWRLALELQEAKKLNELLDRPKRAEDEKLITFPISTTTGLQISNHDLLYIEAAENYISVVWYDGKAVKRDLIRMTMKDAHRMINDPVIGFSHRSFIVNLRKVDRIVTQSGAQMLRVSGVELLIPLSSTYKNSIRQRLNDLL